MRELIVFACEGETLIGSLDDAPSDTGLLIVSGGNEPRMGAHRGMALLAGRISAAGWPVFRFDRRGVGDSSGENGGWAESGPDIAAAAATFRTAAPRVRRLVGFGNCDAATALALFGKDAGVNALVLANPWVVERGPEGLPPPAAIRARYAERLRQPGEWLRLTRGGVDFGKLLSGLRSVLTDRRERELPRRFADVLRNIPTIIVLARGDATAISYADAVKDLGVAAETVVVQTASHSFAREADMERVEAAIASMLDQQGRKRDPSSRPG